MKKTKSIEWIVWKNIWISKIPVLPGVWQRKEGGHFVRARAKESTTGKLRDIQKVLPEADAPTALKWLNDEKARIRGGVGSTTLPRPRFSAFAASHFEHKVTVGDIKSASGRLKWAFILQHLIGGTTGKKSKKHVTGFGEMFVDRIEVATVDSWKAKCAELIMLGDYKPATVNGWIATLNVIMKAARRQFSLPRLATEGLGMFDTSEHATYTEEEPNALLPDEVASFMATFRRQRPAHYAMVFVGLITGLRPSSLRPLRRRGAEPDVLWDKNRLLVRRSHTVGDEVMRTTKQKRRYAIDLPVEAIEVLRWHVETQLKTPEQQESDLLFPTKSGGFRSCSVLNKPLGCVAEELGLGKRVTQRALRRTFNDLARAAQVADVVTRSISGHLTDTMQRHYSTVNGGEQREALAKVIRLFDGSKAPAAAADVVRAPGGEESPSGGVHGGVHTTIWWGASRSG